MDGTYKRYLYEDIPVPRRTRHRRKQVELIETKERLAAGGFIFESRMDHGSSSCLEQTSVRTTTDMHSNEALPQIADVVSESDSEIQLAVCSSNDSSNADDDKLSEISSIDSNATRESNGEIQPTIFLGSNSNNADDNIYSDTFSTDSDVESEYQPKIMEVSEDDDDDADLITPVPLPKMCQDELHDLSSIPQHKEPLLLSENLCNCTTTTQSEAMVMVLSLGIRHGISWVGMVDILNLINKLFTRKVLPDTKYSFLKHIEPVNETVMYHMYCPLCEKFLGSKSQLGTGAELMCACLGDTNNTQPSSVFFMTLGLKNQFQNLMKNSNVVQGMNYRFERKKSCDTSYEDIYDGAVYQRLSKPGEILSCKYNMSYTWNTDGISFGLSSKQSIWPIYIMVNELPPKLRAKHMILAGIWVGKSHPNMKIFLTPFIKEANELSSVGFTWSPTNGVEVNSKVIPLCACVDSPARCRMLNMKQYNGYYGCTMCKHPGIRTASGIRYDMSTDIPPDRSHEKIVKVMLQAHQKASQRNTKIKELYGIKGPSPLINLEYFDLVENMVPDYMHMVLLGVVKSHMELLLSCCGKDYYIGSPHTIETIDARLQVIKPPKSITRTPRLLSERSLWKASEWRSWLLFYGLVCMEKILRNKYLVHFGMLSLAIKILLQKSISPDEVEYADILLLKYVSLYQEYFGVEAMLYNVHLLTHTIKSVLNWGPLWTHNTFPFEGENHYLLQLQKSPVHVAQHISRKFLTFKNLSRLCDKYKVSEDILFFCEHLCKKTLRCIVRSNKTVLVGKGTCQVLGQEEKYCLEIQGFSRVVEGMSYMKFFHNGVRFTCTSYEAASKTDDSCVYLRDGTYARIEGIFEIINNNSPLVILFAREICLHQQSMLHFQGVKITHIMRILGEGVLRAVQVEEVVGQCIMMSLNNGNFLTSIPYGCYGD